MRLYQLGTLSCITKSVSQPVAHKAQVKALYRSGMQHVGLPVRRYRAAITEELTRTCKVDLTAVWRQAKEMLKEEGIEVATDAGNGAQTAPSDATEAAVQVCVALDGALHATYE